jgi:hypothetical protein
MDSTNIDQIYREIHRLQKSIVGAERRFLLDHWTLFEYRPGVVYGWKRRLNELLDLDMQQRPNILRNGGRSP